MRKQTKIAALISAAAVLSVGGAMTAFAAPGWEHGYIITETKRK